MLFLSILLFSIYDTNSLQSRFKLSLPNTQVFILLSLGNPRSASIRNYVRIFNNAYHLSTTVFEHTFSALLSIIRTGYIG